MKRYVISPIVGSGTLADPYRAAVSNVNGTNTSSIIPSNPDGTPKFDFALSIVAAINLVPVQQVSNSYVFPEYSLDGQMSGMGSDASVGMEQSVEAYNLDGNGLHLNAGFQPTETYRDVLVRIAQQIEPAFNINTFDVAELDA